MKPIELFLKHHMSHGLCIHTVSDLVWFGMDEPGGSKARIVRCSNIISLLLLFRQITYSLKLRFYVGTYFL